MTQTRGNIHARKPLNSVSRAMKCTARWRAPAAMIGPGEKLGRYRVGRRALIADTEGNSRISYADYADAFVSELENKAYPQEIVTAAY